MNHNYYQLLGISSSASSAEVKAAYKRLALQYHPDRNAGSAFAEEQFKRINEAYQVLSQPGRRAAYDWQLQYEARLRAQPIPPTEPAAPAWTYAPHPQPVPTAPFPWKRVLRVSIPLLLALALFLKLYTWWQDRAVAQAYQNALSAEEREDWPLAEEQYSLVISYQDENAKALLQRAKVRQQYLTNPEGAAADFTAVLQLTETPEASLYAQRAKCYLSLKQYDNAIRDLDKAIRGDSSLWSAYVDRGIAHMQLEDNWEQAVKDLTQFLQQAALDQRREEVLLYRSFAFYRMGNQELAWQDAAQVLEGNQDHAQAYYLQAKVKQAQQETEKACELLATSAALGFAAAQAERERNCP